MVFDLVVLDYIIYASWTDENLLDHLFDFRLTKPKVHHILFNTDDRKPPKLQTMGNILMHTFQTV